MLRARAGRPPANRPRSHREQERGRVRGCREHLLCGQSRRRRHRLRHPAEVRHRRPRLRAGLCVHRSGPGQRKPAQLPFLPCPSRLQGGQQGHPQVRGRQGQGQPRYRARCRHAEDGPQSRCRDRRVGRRRLRASDPGRPGDGRPRGSHQLPGQHLVGPDGRR